MDPRIRTLACSIGCALACFAGWAEEAAKDEVSEKESSAPKWKVTTAWYHFSNDANAGDFNFRYTWKEVGNLWLGYYLPERYDDSQWRAGWDSQLDLEVVRLLPSLQVASSDFVGGSLAAETGTTWFAGVGYGRTNLKPYVNLNFDPNDSYSVYGGYRWKEGTSLSALWVQDIRENPDQRHLHFIYRTPMPGEHRLTVDVLLKTGQVAGRTIRKIGASVTYDWPRFFVRVAYDPNANFAPEDLWRVAVGFRF
jgi:hypothetical protein